MDLDQLIAAIKSQDQLQLEKILQENPAFAERQTEHGVSLLLLAAYYRNQGAVETLRSLRTSISFYEAAAIGDLAAIKETLAAQPDLLNLPAKDGFSGLGLACFFGHYEIAAFLVEQGVDVNQASANDFKVSPLHSAAAIANYEICELLLQKGADVHAKQASGVTPLHSAAHHGKLDVVSLLLGYGADPNVKMEDGKTAIEMAQEGGFTDVVELLEASN